jgi:PIN domain nuclease of toxin-antitoxin system
MKKELLLDSNVLIQYENNDEHALELVSKLLLDSDNILYITDITEEEVAVKGKASTMQFIKDNFNIFIALRPFTLNRPKKNQYWKWDSLAFGDDRMYLITSAYMRIVPSDFSRFDEKGSHISSHKNDIDIMVNAVYRNFKLVALDKTMNSRYKKLLVELKGISLPNAEISIKLVSQSK